MASDTRGWKSVIAAMIALSLYSELYMPNIILFTPISVLSPRLTGLFNEAKSNVQSAGKHPNQHLAFTKRTVPDGCSLAITVALLHCLAMKTVCPKQDLYARKDCKNLVCEAYTANT